MPGGYSLELREQFGMYAWHHQHVPWVHRADVHERHTHLVLVYEIRRRLPGKYVTEYARKHDVEKYIQISTDEVYGSIEKGSFNEDDILNPSSPYSASKAV